MSLSYRINNYITLKLIEGQTKIYIEEKEFLICKGIILNIPKDDVFEKDEMSMDDLQDKFMYLEEKDISSFGIIPETEFLVHCSNLQVWVENNYNADLLESRLAFPLLKRLTEAGDIEAKKAFKEEIARRYGDGSYNTQQFLSDEGYLEYLSLEEIINGSLESNEANNLFDIINFMKDSLGIRYNLALTLDEDRYRYRTDPLERYFTIFKGHVYEFEFDLFSESFDFFSKLTHFAKLNWLDLFISGDKMPNFSGIRFESIKILKIITETPDKIPDFSSLFPNSSFLVANEKINIDYSRIKSNILKDDIEIVKNQIYQIIKRHSSGGLGISFTSLLDIMEMTRDELVSYIDHLFMESKIYETKKNIYYTF